MVDECEDEWRHPDLQGEDWAGAMHARKDDLGVRMTSGWLGHRKGARGFI